MSEVNLRIANFTKSFSMFAVIASLLYMYAYASDRLGFLDASDHWVKGISKSSIFYVGLGFFTVFNVVVNIWMGMYRSATGVDSNSILFRNERKKRTLCIWFTYMIAGINVLTASIVAYLAMVKINEIREGSDYIYLPTIGFVFLAVILIGLVGALLNKK